MTDFRLDVTVEAETLTEKRIRAVAETEITSIERPPGSASAGLCPAGARAGDVVSRDRKTSPGRMALTGGGASLEQSGPTGRILANERVYFLSPLDGANSSEAHRLGDFIGTDPGHPALYGAQFLTQRIDIIATPSGDARAPLECLPDLGASQRYEGEGERRSFVWHAIDLRGVPERFLAQAIEETKDVTVSVMDAMTRAPIPDAKVTIRGLEGRLADFEVFKQRHLSGVNDSFIQDLYAEFSTSDFFRFTALQAEYRDGDKFRILSDQPLVLAVAAQAPGYVAANGKADIGGAKRNLQIYMQADPGSENAGPQNPAAGGIRME